MKRTIDILISALLLIVLAPIFIILAVAVRWTSTGPAVFVSRRVGARNEIFEMLKFRTMRTDTPQVATHLLDEPQAFLTPIGSFLRKTSLDELPQLINVLCGEMSIVGPRPALFNQQDLIDLRTKSGVHFLVPGLTGWAQVNGRDELSIPVKVEYDSFYMKHQSLGFDFKILLLTVGKVFGRSGVSH